MPGFDGTGPLGQGAMTGWRRGWYTTGSAPQLQQETTLQAAGTESQEQSAPKPGPVIYGQGRGGIPWGCGRGFGESIRGGRCGGRRWRT